MISQTLLNDPRPWSFSQAVLTAGLRAHTNDSNLVITDLNEITIPHRRPSMGRIRGLSVLCDTDGEKKGFRLTVKEPQGSTRIGTAGVGLREVSFYRNLTDQLPMHVPHLFASDPNGEWLIMEMLPLDREPENWSAGDYLLSIKKLVALHDRFWELGSDLSIYPWLARPLGTDYDIYLQAAKTGLHRLSNNNLTEPFSHEPMLIRMIKRLVEHADQIALSLRAAPATLLHGDYWPGNIAIDEDGVLYVYDWQQASIGPGVLDLFHFIQTSQWYFNPLPITPRELISAYRTELFNTTHFVWDESNWNALWDYALLWDFLINWVDMLANIPTSLLQTLNLPLRTLWLEPVDAALNRRLSGV